MRLRLPRNLLEAFPRLDEPPTSEHYAEPKPEWKRILYSSENSGVQPFLDEWIAEAHLACHVAKHSRADPDDPRVSGHQSCEDAAPPHDKRQ